jgi:hypothetical protein
MSRDEFEIDDFELADTGDTSPIEVNKPVKKPSQYNLASSAFEVDDFELDVSSQKSYKAAIHGDTNQDEFLEEESDDEDDNINVIKQEDDFELNETSTPETAPAIIVDKNEQQGNRAKLSFDNLVSFIGSQQAALEALIYGKHAYSAGMSVPINVSAYMAHTKGPEVGISSITFSIEKDGTTSR